ncbi:MAG: M28 family peptidase [Armatimonadota bacterium]
MKYLASPELEGRESGQKGNALAADYLARRFKAAGLKPAGEKGTYYQRFPVFTGVRLGNGNALEFRVDGETRRLELGEQFAPLAFSGNGSAGAPVVFAGYGISKPELGYDDYAHLDVKGKIVVVLRHTPDNDDEGKFGPFAQLTYKTMTAREKGAAGILLLTGPLSEVKEDLGVDPAPNGQGLPRLRYGLASGSTDCGIPAAFVSAAQVDELLAGSGKKLRDLQLTMAHGQPASFPLEGATARVTVRVERQTAPTRNVIGLLEGSDPKLKHEVVVVGAHFDHLGHGGAHSLSGNGKPEIHHGADDNASGTAGLLELAQYFGANRKKLGRSVLFMGFSGEEMGLLGSNYWTKHPTIPLERVVAMVNMDMVGRLKDDTFWVIGGGTSPAWKGLLDQVNAKHRFQMKVGGRSGFGGSDQQSFYAKGIPVLFFFTGVHADYHKPSDTWEKVNADGAARLFQFVADSVERVSRLAERPAFTRSAEEEQAPGPGFRVYLGTIPDYAEEVEGVMLQGVREGSPAEKAGIRGGDVLVEFDGKKIRNVQEYTVVLSTARPNVPVKIVVLRKGERIELSITPAAR